MTYRTFYLLKMSALSDSKADVGNSECHLIRQQVRLGPFLGGTQIIRLPAADPGDLEQFTPPAHICSEPQYQGGSGQCIEVSKRQAK